MTAGHLGGDTSSAKDGKALQTSPVAVHSPVPCPTCLHARAKQSQGGSDEEVARRDDFYARALSKPSPAEQKADAGKLLPDLPGISS